MRRHARLPRRGFTLVEVLVAGLVATMVLGSISVSLGQLGRAKSMSTDRFNAHLRANAALRALRSDAASVVRSDDLFYTRLLLTDDEVETAGGRYGRDELLLLNTRLRRIRNFDSFNGEGVEYETQYRIEEDELGPVLWQRRDAMADENLHGGGVASPLAEGILGLEIEAFDGEQWRQTWDSDGEGLPHALRLTVMASGHRGPDDLYEAPVAIMRTIVAIDRVAVPRDHYDAEEAERIALEEAEQAAAAEEAANDEGGGGPGLESAGPGEDGVSGDDDGGASGGGRGGGGRGGGGRGGGGGGRGGRGGGGGDPSGSGSGLDRESGGRNTSGRSGGGQPGGTGSSQGPR